jgi:hypothetical protein
MDRSLVRTLTGSPLTARMPDDTSAAIALAWDELRGEATPQRGPLIRPRMDAVCRPAPVRPCPTLIATTSQAERCAVHLVTVR